MADKYNPIIVDSDHAFSIDPTTRAITNNSNKVKVMQYDHNSERFTFVLPKEIEGHDMTKCNSVQIHWKIVTSKTRQTKNGVVNIEPDNNGIILHACSDTSVSDYNNKLEFSWLLSHNVTQYEGALSFVVRFSYKKDENTTAEYRWVTDVCSAISIVAGIDSSSSIEEEYSDVILQWGQDLDNHILDCDQKLDSHIVECSKTIDDKLDKLDADLETFKTETDTKLTEDLELFKTDSKAELDKFKSTTTTGIEKTIHDLAIEPTNFATEEEIYAALDYEPSYYSNGKPVEVHVFTQLDEEVNGKSDNPVTNKGIYNAVQTLDGKIKMVEDKIAEPDLSPFLTKAEGSKAIDDINSRFEIMRSSNLLNPDELEIGKFISLSDGSIVDNTSSNSTGFIEVKEGDTISLQIKSSEKSASEILTMSHVAPYDENHTYLGNSAGISVDSFTVPDGVKYVRISYTPFKTDHVELTNIGVANNVYIDTSTGLGVQTNSNYITTKLIPVSAGEVVRLRLKNGTTDPAILMTTIAPYDEYKNYISSNYVTSVYEYTVPNKAKYICITYIPKSASLGAENYKVTKTSNVNTSVYKHGVFASNVVVPYEDYYNKLILKDEHCNEKFTKEMIDEALAKLDIKNEILSVKVVDALPTADINENALYLLDKKDGSYEYYVYSGGWVKISGLETEPVEFATEDEVKKVLYAQNGDYIEGGAKVIKVLDDGSVNITTSLKVDASPKDPTDVIRLMDTATISDIDTLFNITTSGSGPVKATTITINNATVDKTVLALTKNNAAVQNSTLTIKP